MAHMKQQVHKDSRQPSVQTATMADHTAQQSVPSTAATVSNPSVTTMPPVTTTVTVSTSTVTVSTPAPLVQQPDESAATGTAGDDPAMDQPMDLTLDEDDPDAVVWYDDDNDDNDDNDLEEGEIIVESSNVNDPLEVQGDMVEHPALYSSPPPDTMYVHTNDSTGVHVHTPSPQDKDAPVQLGAHLELQPVDLEVTAHIEKLIGTAFSAAVSASVQQYLQQQSAMQEPATIPICSSTVPITAASSMTILATTSIAAGTSIVALGSGGAVLHLGCTTWQSTGQGKSQGAGADVRHVHIRHTDPASHPPDTTVPTMMTPTTPAPVTKHFSQIIDQTVLGLTGK